MYLGLEPCGTGSAFLSPGPGVIHNSDTKNRIYILEEEILINFHNFQE
jgi:hypothetical protein